MKRIFLALFVITSCFGASESEHNYFIKIPPYTHKQAISLLLDGIPVDMETVEPVEYPFASTLTDGEIHLLLLTPESDIFLEGTQKVAPKHRLEIENRARSKHPKTLALINAGYFYWKFPRENPDDCLDKAIDFFEQAECSLADYYLSQINHEAFQVPTIACPGCYGETDGDDIAALRAAAEKRCKTAFKKLGEIYEKKEGHLAVALQCYQAANVHEKLAIFKNHLNTKRWTFHENTEYQIIAFLPEMKKVEQATLALPHMEIDHWGTEDFIDQLTTKAQSGDLDALYELASVYDGHHSSGWRRQTPSRYEAPAPTVLWFYEQCAKWGHPEAVKIMDDLKKDLGH